MNKILIVLGIGLIAGAVSYVIWEQMQKEKQATQGSTHNNENTDKTPENIVITDISDAEADASATRNSVASEINDRHNEAAQIMKDAVDIICKRSEISEDETKELEQISDQLDNLLEDEK